MHNSGSLPDWTAYSTCDFTDATMLVQYEKGASEGGATPTTYSKAVTYGSMDAGNAGTAGFIYFADLNLYGARFLTAIYTRGCH
jgi:hypothetical protein